MRAVAKLSIKTVTRLEYESEELLSIDIQHKLFGNERNRNDEYMNLLFLVMPLTVYQCNQIRRQAEKGVHQNTSCMKRILNIVPANEIFEVIIAEPANKTQLSIQISEFVHRLSNGFLRLGDNTTLGCGICVCTELQAESGFTQTDLQFEQVKNSIYYQNNCDKVTIKAHSEAGILIRNQTGFGLPYASNEEGNPIIPASTWKGIFRNAIMSWLNYMDADKNVLYEMFGNKEMGIKGRLIFYDSVITEPQFIEGRRIHIDKFTGNVFTNGLTKKIYVAGKFIIRIDCLKKIDEYKPYIVTVLRDFSLKRINVGADFGIGKGFIELDEVSFYK